MYLSSLCINGFQTLDNYIGGTRENWKGLKREKAKYFCFSSCMERKGCFITSQMKAVYV